MDTTKTTIIVMSYDGEPTKTISISTSLIKNLKKYLKVFAVFSLVVFITLSLFFVNYILTIRENKLLSEDMSSIKKKVDLLDSVKLNEKMQNIETNLSGIHTYLIERGALKVENAGGDDVKEDIDLFSRIDLFEEQSVVFKNKIENLPVGYPYSGVVSSEYGYRTNPFGGYSGEFHPGIDFKGETGDEIYATGKGIVERCDWYNGYGNAVVIRHDDGLIVIYGHMTKVNVSQGQSVKAGEVIGFIGSTGRSTGPHLHYEIRKNGEDINPNIFLNFNRTDLKQ